MSNCRSLAGQAFSLSLALTLYATGAEAQNLHWNAAGTPSDSFELTDGPVPGAQPGDQVFTATNTCDSSTVRATFGNPTGVADPGEPFVGLRTADTIDWWIEGSAFDDPLTAENDARHTLTLEFLGDPVEDLQFTIFDIDRGGWEDQYLISGTFVSAVNVTATTCGSSISCGGSGTSLVTATGTGGAPFGGAAGNLVVTIPGPVQEVNIVYQVGPADNDSTGFNGDQLTGISDMSFACSTVPITLSSFLASPARGGEARFDWTTATETANVGFHIYGEVDGEWKRLNRRLLPSHSLDSLAPRSYETRLRTFGARQFMVADVDTRGRQTMHGPFELGTASGVPATAEPFDWGPIRERHEARTAERRQARRVGASAPLARKSTTNALESSPAGYELRVSTAGLYRVPFESVPGLAGVAVETLAVTQKGKPLQIHVGGNEETGLFGPGGYVDFYGRSLSTLYTDTNVYQLRSDAASALRGRVAEQRLRGRPVTSYVAERRIEKQVAYSFASPNGDPWYEASILAYDEPASKSFEFEVDRLSSGDQTLMVDLWGVTDWPDLRPDHHVTIALNGQTVADEWFDGLSEQALEIPLAPGQLVSGTNELTITSLGDTGARYDLIHVDGYGARFGRRPVAVDDRFSAVVQGPVLSIAGFSSSDVIAYRQLNNGFVRIANATPVADRRGTYRVRVPGSRHREWNYLVSTLDALLEPEIAPLPEAVPIDTRHAEYVVISHPDFLGGLDRLVAAREADGLSVKVVDVEQIYLQYSSGVFDPEAIRLFIADSIRSLGGRYFLLVGGDTYDYFDHLGIGSISFIPSIYAATHSVVNFAPSDASFTDVSLDGKPNAAIGRFPVRTPDELELMIDKTLAYSAASGRAVFAADESDGAYSFADLSDELGGVLSRMAVETAYLDELTVNDARATLMDAIDQGAALTHYFGHSGPAAWTFRGLFGSTDADRLTNHHSPTVALQWGCWGGYHSVPQFDTLSHRLLLGGAHGAAAVLGASSLTEVASDRELARRVYQHLSIPGTRLGDAIQLAKSDLGASYRDVLLSMTLLGDPALVID